MVAQRLAKIGCSVNVLAALTGTSGPTLSRLLNGQAINHDLMNQVEDTLQHLEKLKSAAEPLPIDFSQAGTLKDILEDLRNETLTISVVKYESNTPVKGFVVQLLSNGHYYSRIKNNEVITMLNQNQAALMIEPLADRVVQLLAEKGYQSRKVQSLYGDFEGIACLLEHVWPETVNA